MEYLKSIKKSREIKNASWIIGGRVIQMILSFFIGILTARYLGPSTFGLISYVSSYVAFFTSLCTLGINSIIVKDLIDNPDEQGTAIGTSLVLRAVSSLLSSIMIVCIVSIVDKGDRSTIFISLLCSIALVFQVFDTINYWFQSKYQSKTTAKVTLIAYIVVSIYKIILLARNMSIEWFALASSVDYIVVASLLFSAYYKNGGPLLRFNWQKAKILLKNSYHYILSGMMVAIYSQSDRLMLKHMLNESEVGYYTIAANLSTMWVFIATAIIDSMYPTIIALYNKDGEGENFENINILLYRIIFYLSCVVSLFFVIFGDQIVLLLYGHDYQQSIAPLKIITWYVAFSNIGIARNPWIVCTHNQKYLKYIYVSAAVINIILNMILIPIMRSSGAALASLITQILTSLVLPFFIFDMRPNAKLIVRAFLFNKTS